MNVLVTGAGGFIGSYLVKKLESEGYNVYIHSHKTGDLVTNDIADLYSNKIDVVCHLAARTFVPESWNSPEKYINDNNRMLISLLECCRRWKSKMIFISTYLYGEPEYLPVDERHRCMPGTPYHLSKKIGEEICEFYSRHFDIGVVVLRPFNIYGYGQSGEFLLPKIYRQVISDKNYIEVFNLSPKRDYIYVEDFVEILVRLIPYIDQYEIYNIGTGISYSVREVIEIIQNELGTEKEIIEKFEVRKNEIMDCYADVRKITGRIGEIKFTGLAEGIARWYEMDKSRGGNL